MKLLERNRIVLVEQSKFICVCIHFLLREICGLEVVRAGPHLKCGLQVKNDPPVYHPFWPRTLAYPTVRKFTLLHLALKDCVSSCFQFKLHQREHDHAHHFLHIFFALLSNWNSSECKMLQSSSSRFQRKNGGKIGGQPLMLWPIINFLTFSQAHHLEGKIWFSFPPFQVHLRHLSLPQWNQLWSALIGYGNRAAYITGGWCLHCVTCLWQYKQTMVRDMCASANNHGMGQVCPSSNQTWWFAMRINSMSTCMCETNMALQCETRMCVRNYNRKHKTDRTGQERTPWNKRHGHIAGSVSAGAWQNMTLWHCNVEEPERGCVAQVQIQMIMCFTVPHPHPKTQKQNHRAAVTEPCSKPIWTDFFKSEFYCVQKNICLISIGLAMEHWNWNPVKLRSCPFLWLKFL